MRMWCCCRLVAGRPIAASAATITIHLPFAMQYSCIPLWLFQQKWRLRYFVLFVPPVSCGSVAMSRSGDAFGRRDALSSGTGLGLCRMDSNTSPGPQLCYYDNEQLDRQHGKIDLRRCDALLTGKESGTSASEQQHIFALRMRTGSATVGKGTDGKKAGTSTSRTYYLSASDEATMNKWVDCLKEVLRKHGICEGKTCNCLFSHVK